MNIKLVKLINGDMIIADVSSQGETVVLKNPYVIISTQNGIGLMSYMEVNVCKGDSITFKDEHVLFISDLVEEISNAYKTKTGTGIVTSGGILT
uniref:Uncharacterized protein n=1 Tax=viral metagenome TaxID=1070528 RepID=A0A6M3LJ10_9ZZZZ